MTGMKTFPYNARRGKLRKTEAFENKFQCLPESQQHHKLPTDCFMLHPNFSQQPRSRDGALTAHTQTHR